jgi:hypothetical protein
MKRWRTAEKHPRKIYGLAEKLSPAHRPAGFTPAGFSCRAPIASVWLKLWLIVYLCERDAEPILFPPYDPAMSAHLIGHHGQHEFVGNS